MANIENKSLLAVKSLIRSKIPWLISPVLKIASRTFLYKNERSYLLNPSAPDNAQIDSVVLLSQPRGGTQVCEQVISEVFRRAGGQSLHLGKFLFWYDNKKVNQLRNEAWAKENLVSKGYFFGNFGSYKDITELPKLKYVVMCRDPRDVLLSHYFSIRDAHILNSRDMRQRSENANSLNLDDYVLQADMIEDVRSYTKQAIKMRSSDHSHLFIRYEDMMSDPKYFVQKVAEFLDLNIDDQDTENIVDSCNLRPISREDTESTLRHRRSGHWGQYRKKLKPETKEKLWQAFDNELAKLGYEKDSLKDIRETL